MGGVDLKPKKRRETEREKQKRKKVHDPFFIDWK
jgi:hypothetical protein